MTDTGVFSYLHLHCSEKGQTFFLVTVYIMVSTPRGDEDFRQNIYYFHSGNELSTCLNLCILTYKLAVN